MLPLLLNCIAALALLATWDRILQLQGFDSPARLGGLLFLWIVVPLTPLALLGMEHILQILLTTTLIWSCACRIDEDDGAAKSAWIIPLVILAVAVRYETIFAIGPMILIALWRRRFSIALMLGVGAALPVIAFGLYWTSHGGLFLPNPLLLKGIQPAHLSGVADFWRNILANAKANIQLRKISLAVLGAAAINALLLARSHRTLTAGVGRARIVSLVTLVATAVQYCFGAVGWLYRYESWLMALNGLSVLLLLSGSVSFRPFRLGRVQATSLCGLAIMLLGGPRAFADFHQTVLAVADRRNEHLPPAAFIHDYYRNKTIMANDIGMLTYYGGARILDIYGLGTNEPLKFMRQPNGYGPLQLSRWAAEQHVAIAIAQICWDPVFKVLPDDWQLVEVWHIPRNVVFSDKDVGIFAVDPDEADALRAVLVRFSLPPGIAVKHFNAADYAALLDAERNNRPPANGICSD
jgi:hypothetical protein